MTTEGDCIDALRQAARQLGKSPTKAEYEDLGMTPASATIIRVMGGWNEAKEQADLSTHPSTGSRTKPKPDDVSLPRGVSWDDLTADQRWHCRHPDVNTERSLARRRRLRAWLHIHKASLGCSQCDEADPACLDFHHVRGEKEMAVNKMVVYGYSTVDIHAEIEKCDVLCANCHRKEHHGSEQVNGEGTGIEPSGQEPSTGHPRTKRERLQAWTNEYKGKRGCQRCEEDIPPCLQFHHPDNTEKTKGIGAMISDSDSEEAVHAEVNRCDVLCANCHRKEHYETPLSFG